MASNGYYNHLPKMPLVRTDAKKRRRTFMGKYLSGRFNVGMRRFPQIPFAVIFTTGYDKYAIRAIHFSALDYC
jgi:hypothetical protein